MTENRSVKLENWTCPLPLRDYPNVVLGHGGGGKLSAELIKYLFLPSFENEILANLGDSAIIEIGGQRLAVSTDSFVVHPLFFPGGCIGDLAIYGTVNDIAMSGATPLFLSVGFIIEEGLSLTVLGNIVERMAQSAKNAGVLLITGDTKVVDKGHGDGLFINTTGIGLLAPEINIAPNQAAVGDVVIVSGTIGDHGMAVMSVREGLEFDTIIESDTAPLNGLVSAMLDTSYDIHVLRDPTRGGLASTLNEIANTSNVGIVLDEQSIPVNPAVQAACEMLGMDPLYVANEGKLVAIVPQDKADIILATMKQHPLGQKSAIIGTVVEQHPGILIVRTPIGGSRVVDMQIGEQLPRIC
jgi:hydrogenase expression/formation protein HypE